MVVSYTSGGTRLSWSGFVFLKSDSKEPKSCLLYIYIYFKKLSVLSLPSSCPLLPLAVTRTLPCCWVRHCLRWAGDLPRGCAIHIVAGTTQVFEHPTSSVPSWASRCTCPNPWQALRKILAQLAQDRCVCWKTKPRWRWGGRSSSSPSQPPSPVWHVGFEEVPSLAAAIGISACGQQPAGLGRGWGAGCDQRAA